MKKAVKVFIVLILVLSSTCSINIVFADSIDAYFKSSLNGVAGDTIENSRSSITIEPGSGSISNGKVGTGGVTITIHLKTGYIFEKVIIDDNLYTPESSSTTISLAEGDLVNKIEVAVIDTVNAYNKPINVDVTTFKYGLKLNDIVINPNDTDLVLMGKNLFYDYSLTPVSEISNPGIYSLFMVFDSTEFMHFPGDYNHNYINDVTISGSYYIDKEVVHNYDLKYASKEINLSDDSQNFYLYLLPYFYLPGLSVEYLANAGSDMVSNMPTNELNAYLADAPVTINSTDIPIRSGYDFVGWSLTDSGEVITNVVMPNTGLKLYAIWNKQNSESSNKEEKVVASSIQTYTPVNTGID